MRKLTTAAIGATCLVLGAGGATLYTHAATGPAFYGVYETNVTDEDAYKKALPDAQKIIGVTERFGDVWKHGGQPAPARLTMSVTFALTPAWRRCGQPVRRVGGRRKRAKR